MAITQILSIAINFTIALQVCLAFLKCFDVTKNRFSLGWQSMMECDEGLAYSSREHDCVPLELSDCAAK